MHIPARLSTRHARDITTTETSIPDPRLVHNPSIESTTLSESMHTMRTRRQCGGILPPCTRNVQLLSVPFGRFVGVELFAEFLDLVAQHVGEGLFAVLVVVIGVFSKEDEG